jgi:hypothetical protein
VEGRDRDRVTEWVPLEGKLAGLELFVLVDEAADTRIAAQFDELRRFMLGQPDSTAIGVAYIRNGTVDIVQELTKDHSQAGKALRLPLGSTAAASPYLSVTELIKRWPESAARREVLMISDGVDPLQGGPADSYLQEAVERAQRAGVQVYSIYATGAGHIGHTYWRRNWGQSNMSQLADETGGEAYFQGFQTPVAYAPFLEEFASRLKHQYRLTFLAKPEPHAGYQHVTVETEVPNAELVAADRVYVPAAE